MYVCQHFYEISISKCLLVHSQKYNIISIEHVFLSAKTKNIKFNQSK